MPSPSKANYKSYEAQARMIRAIVAAHPEVKWNYKEMTKCYGSDMTKDAINHRFRLYKAQAKLIKEAMARGYDMKDLTNDEKILPKSQDAVDEKNIAKYFGQSTADGIQFQFRAIKKDAENIKETVKKGGDPSKCLDILSSRGSGSGSATATPSKPTAFKNVTPRTGGRGTQKRPRQQSITQPQQSISEDDSDNPDEIEEQNWSDKDETPTKRPRTGRAAAPGQKNGVPARQAATMANDTIANVTQLLGSESASASASASDVETPTQMQTQTPSSSAPLPPTVGKSAATESAAAMFAAEGRYPPAAHLLYQAGNPIRRIHDGVPIADYGTPEFFGTGPNLPYGMSGVYGGNDPTNEFVGDGEI